jgi:hypothetical protein
MLGSQPKSNGIFGGAEKLYMDFTASLSESWPYGKPQEDQDLIDLVTQLCTRADIILEDSSVTVLELSQADRRQLQTAVILGD